MESPTYSVDSLFEVTAGDQPDSDGSRLAFTGVMAGALVYGPPFVSAEQLGRAYPALLELRPLFPAGSQVTWGGLDVVGDVRVFGSLPAREDVSGELVPALPNTVYVCFRALPEPVSVVIRAHGAGVCALARVPRLGGAVQVLGGLCPAVLAAAVLAVGLDVVSRDDPIPRAGAGNG
jgi:hypothetical protein